MQEYEWQKPFVDSCVQAKEEDVKKKSELQDTHQHHHVLYGFYIFFLAKSNLCRCS